MTEYLRESMVVFSPRQEFINDRKMLWRETSWKSTHPDPVEARVITVIIRYTKPFGPVTSAIDVDRLLDIN